MSLIIAIDTKDEKEIINIVKRLAPKVTTFKIGLEAFIANGPDIVNKVKDIGADIFLDLKLHDIPNTVGSAVKAVSALNVSMLTVHALGGADMIMAAKEHAGNTKIIAVTVLTSMNDTDIINIGFQNSVSVTARQLGETAIASGADGLVCSALELSNLKGIDGIRVVPGIRPNNCNTNDQKRIATPYDAISTGADWIVVGRPILQAPNPEQVAEDIIGEINMAKRGKTNEQCGSNH